MSQDNTQGLVWWRAEREALITLMRGREAAYVTHLPTVVERCHELNALGSIDHCLYAVKANSDPQVLEAVAGLGLGFECVSLAEVEHVRRVLPDMDPQRILFTPNFAPRHEYAEAIKLGIWLTVDGLHPLQHWPEMFRDQPIILRFNPDRPRGHHKHVETAGPRAKFGLPIEDAETVAGHAQAAGARVVGLHAHAGSGVEEASHWHEIASVLSDLLYLFPQARFLDVGGGLGIPKHQATPRLDLARVDTTLQAFKAQVPGVDLWMEPGRYVVAEAGVLLARVTQIKQAFRQRFIGLSTGMNSLIRPALYGSYHGIWNLSRIDAPSAGLATIVGPICESADVFGLDREMPDTREDDIILIDNAGAYGHTMASHYNLREPAEPLTIGAQAIQAVAAE